MGRTCESTTEVVTTMTVNRSSIDLPALMAQHLQRAEPDLRRSMLSTFVAALMSAEADAICGARYGERSPERTQLPKRLPDPAESPPPPEDRPCTCHATGPGAGLAEPDRRRPRPTPAPRPRTIAPGTGPPGNRLEQPDRLAGSRHRAP